MKINLDEFQLLKARLKEKGSFSATIISGSMLPLIKVGDIIEFVPVQTDQLKVFDIVVFWTNQMLVCHFVLKIKTVDFNSNGSRMVTMALATANTDFPFLEERLLGKVVNFKLSFWMKFKIFVTFWYKQRK